MDITKMLATEGSVKKVKPRQESKEPTTCKDKLDEKKKFEDFLKETNDGVTNKEKETIKESSISKEVNEDDIAKLEEQLTPENKEILKNVLHLVEGKKEFLVGEINLGDLNEFDSKSSKESDLVEILVMLLALMQGNLEKKTMDTLDQNNKLNNFDDFSNNKGLDEMVKELKVLKITDSDSNKALNEILSQIVNKLSEVQNEELGDKLLTLLKGLVNEEKKDFKVQVKEVKQELKKLVGDQRQEEAIKNIIKPETTDVKSQKVQVDDTAYKKGDGESFKSDKEETFLKNLTLEEDKNAKPLSLNTFKFSFGTVDKLKEAPVITKNNAVFDMVKTIRYMNTNALKELTVKVYPKELGEITISISQEQDVMKANIKANSKDAYQVLSNSLNEIKKTLESQGIKIEEVNISLYSDDTTFYREGQEDKNALYNEEMKKSKTNEGLVEEIEEIVSEKVYEGNVNMLA